MPKKTRLAKSRGQDAKAKQECAKAIRALALEAETISYGMKQ